MGVGVVAPSRDCINLGINCMGLDGRDLDLLLHPENPELCFILCDALLFSWVFFMSLSLFILMVTCSSVQCLVLVFHWLRVVPFGSQVQHMFC